MEFEAASRQMRLAVGAPLMTLYRTADKRNGTRTFGKRFTPNRPPCSDDVAKNRTETVVLARNQETTVF